MALYVNTNASSLNAQRMMANSTNALDTSYKRLASGLRINSAKDDAAGLQISDRLTSQINGLNQGNRNAQDGISLAQTAEGALDEMTNMYQRIRTLALQSANGTNSDADRTAIQQEVTQLCSEIDRITKDTTWGGEKILTGEKSTTNALGALAGNGGDTAGHRTSSTIAFQVGADTNQTISVGLGLKKTGETVQVGFSVKDVAYATGAAAANVVAGSANEDLTGKYLKANGSELTFDVSTAGTAQNTLANIDKFIAAVDSKRAELGATQNRLESTIRNQSNVSENVSAARSRIRDTDFASETAAMTQQNIIQQASQSILSQANQRPQVALSLLG
ncbi:flagellin [Succinimonas sp.]|uniref:flagellin N-terminal helical domain-containing protein n=1 Tax=Succinimonas sp. TaxID=1936151 RepID=UPI003866534C